MMMRVGDRWMVAFCLEGLARVVVTQGEAIWAVHLLSAAAALREVIGATLSPLEQLVREQTLNTVHTRLDEQAFATAWTEGQTMSPEQAIAGRSPFRLPSPSVPQEKHSTNTSVAALPLTTREVEVLHLVAQGLTSAQIAEQLVITTLTVNSHIRSIYSKLGVNTRAAATRYALIQPGIS